ncbi:MAG TPA: carbohydrate kinase family protein [Longimicrobiales bacterium]|jgi:sugar/nucleoside kinase (ribokinase family)
MPRLAVLGTMVWDTILQRDRRSEAVEEWGGISYGLAAAAAALPAGWEVVPILKLGRDLSESALRFLRDVPGLDCETGVRVVGEPNARVELRYRNQERRLERLEGSVVSWAWAELAPIVRTCDALYVNFISGFEMELDVARSLRAGYMGPTYADLHSLFLGVGARGIRVPQELPSWGAWLRCFDAVQMNEAEFELLGRSWGDPWRLAADVVGAELKLITVTLGPRGAAYVAGPGFTEDPSHWSRVRAGVGAAGPTRSALISVEGGGEVGDPTGCGDVWGATFFARLLSGHSLEGAMKDAHRMASRNVLHRGARGLVDHLLGRLTRG